MSIIDAQYQTMKFYPSEMEHSYGKNIHILSDPYLLLGLNHLSQSGCTQPLLHYWVGRLYRSLLHNAVNVCFERSEVSAPTRMSDFHPKEAQLSANLPDPNSKIVIVNLARAGIVPSYVCYDELNYFFNAEAIRQDHILIGRTTNSDDEVTGSSIGASKIGGTIDDCYVIIPDPMGATGSTIANAKKSYEKFGRARKWIAMHLIITPEYIRHIQKTHPDIEVFALRLDRGLSSKEVLSQKLGQAGDAEIGLNEKSYIVPGAGGLGEILNNSYV